MRTKIRRTNRRVVIDCLYAEGIRWAGWYGEANLMRKWDEVQGSFMTGGTGRFVPVPR